MTCKWTEYLFSIFCGNRWTAQVPDGVRVRRVDVVAVVRQQQRGHQLGARQLRPLLHHHLQRARWHRVERQLHVAPIPARPPFKVRSPIHSPLAFWSFVMLISFFFFKLILIFITFKSIENIFLNWFLILEKSGKLSKMMSLFFHILDKFFLILMYLKLIFLP